MIGVFRRGVPSFEDWYEMTFGDAKKTKKRIKEFGIVRTIVGGNDAMWSDNKAHALHVFDAAAYKDVKAFHEAREGGPCTMRIMRARRAAPNTFFEPPSSSLSDICLCFIPSISLTSPMCDYPNRVRRNRHTRGPRTPLNCSRFDSSECVNTNEGTKESVNKNDSLPRGV